MRIFAGITLSSCLGLGMAGPTKYELHDYQPLANAAATVVNGDARFTVLTSRLIRMEFATDGKFEDRATLAFMNRDLPVPKFTQAVTPGTPHGSTLTITTDDVKLSYTVGQPFSGATLSATGLTAANNFTWNYAQSGSTDDGNLLGTIKSLDELGVTSLNCTENANITVHDETLHCQWGLISRSGWSVVDDSDNQALEDQQDWWVGVNADTVDSYLFGHGQDYRGAIKDYTLVGGKTAMVPKQAAGLWWTRWVSERVGEWAGESQ
jgi:alpha-glucosidase (family GH31 glycosyl hydrolase)